MQATRSGPARLPQNGTIRRPRESGRTTVCAPLSLITMTVQTLDAEAVASGAATVRSLCSSSCQWRLTRQTAWYNRSLASRLGDAVTSKRLVSIKAGHVAKSWRTVYARKATVGVVVLKPVIPSNTHAMTPSTSAWLNIYRPTGAHRPRL